MIWNYAQKITPCSPPLISGKKKYKIFVPFQNGSQITDFHFSQIWKTIFPKEFFNEIWLKLGDFKGLINFFQTPQNTNAN